MNAVSSPRTGMRVSMGRRWRRAAIVTSYAAYTAAIVLIGIRAHLLLTATETAAVTAALAVISVAFFASLIWRFAPNIQYGLGRRTYRRPAAGELRKLKDNGTTAREAAAMFVRPADEQQRAVREHAQSVSYQILGSIIFVGALYLLLASQLVRGAWLPTTAGEQVILLGGLILLYNTLPEAVIAWSEPDPIGEEGTSLRE